MSKFKNHLKKGFIESFPETCLNNSDLNERFKINFSFFDASQADGSDFSSLSAPQLAGILEKTRVFTRHDLNYWRNQRCGSHGLKIYSDYDSFPRAGTFKHPKAVPHDVKWGRFRLENLPRLIGFTVPSDFKPDPHPKTHAFDCNTFYLVFIDLEHKFYPTKK